jgi:hypothetical protein
MAEATVLSTCFTCGEGRLSPAMTANVRLSRKTIVLLLFAIVVEGLIELS